MSKKSRKLIRAAKPAAEPAAPAPDVAPVAVASPARDFHQVVADPNAEVDERELHELMKDWRHGRATRSIGDAFQDAYVAIFSIVMVGFMVANLVVHAQASANNCGTDSCAAARTLVPWAATAAAYTVALALSRLFGPVLASAAEGFWLMDAPISRRRLLRGRLILAVAAALVVGAVLTGLPSALSGSSVPAIGLWALAGGLGCAGLVAFAAAQQGIEKTRLVQVLQGAFVTAALASLLAVVAVAAKWLPVSLGADPGVLVALTLAVLGLLLVVIAFWLAVRRLDGIRRARLVSGGSLVSGMAGAMYALDFGLARDILVERDAARRGHVTPTTGRGVGLVALIARDFQRVLRFPKPLIGLVLSVLAPYAVDALGLATFNPFISGLILVIVLVPFLSSLRVLTRTGGLARMFPFRTSQLRTAAMAVPGVLALLWHVLTVPAFVGLTGATRPLLDAELIALATAIAGWLGAVRWVTAKKVDFGSPMVATESGAVPPTLIFNLFRGLDVVLLVTAPITLGASPMWSFSLAGVAFIFLRGTFNMDEMNAQKRALDEEREQARAEVESRKSPGASKIRVPRPPSR